MEQHILIFIIFGFIAQLIDGALGMAYGVSSNAFFLTLGDTAFHRKCMYSYIRDVHHRGIWDLTF